LDISRSGYHILVVVASIGYDLLCIGDMQIECKFLAIANCRHWTSRNTNGIQKSITLGSD